ncbi:MAG: LysR substrate-binding domain-containing protein [Gammaproteobacteria bacterium]|jgi:LysR family transcriptional regulator, hydrogen peroxide-inducible genes activator
MTLTELRYIVAVARERHFGRAAEACFVSQPTLSVAVRKLEEELDVPIFERGKGEVTITPAGDLIIAQAQRVLEEASKIYQLSEHGRNQLEGPLRIGAIYTVGPYLFPTIVPELASKAPKMQLAIEENFTAVLTDKLKNGELDVIIISEPYDEPGIETKPIYTEPFVALLPAAHPLTERERLVTADLEQESVLLLGNGHCFRDQVLEFCPECRKQGSRYSNSIQSTIEGGSLETIRYMVASGLGITILPCTACAADRHSALLYRSISFADKEPSRVIAIAWRKSFPRLEAVSLISDVISNNLPECVHAMAGMQEFI